VTVAHGEPAIVERLRAAGCVFAEEEAAVLASSAASADELATLVERRVSGVPLEHVVGWAEFCGLRIDVEPGVFVPRRRTEFLVEQAIAKTPPAATVVDMCCGSGAIGLALASAVHPARLYAVDIDPTAVRCAASNLKAVGGVALCGDLYTPLPADIRVRVDVIVANVPYVPTAAIALMPAEARLHEPRISLDGGGDGLDVFRAVAAAAPGWLAPNGSVLIEVDSDQVAPACTALRMAGLTASSAHSDAYDTDVVCGMLVP
jgi:release factor glutamine methyltransferase